MQIALSVELPLAPLRMSQLPLTSLGPPPPPLQARSAAETITTEMQRERVNDRRMGTSRAPLPNNTSAPGPRSKWAVNAARIDAMASGEREPKPGQRRTTPANS